MKLTTESTSRPAAIKRTEPRMSRMSRIGNCKGAGGFIREIREIRGKIFAKLREAAGVQCKDRKEKQHKFLSMRSLRSFAAKHWLEWHDASLTHGKKRVTRAYPESFAVCSRMHRKGDVSWTGDSVGETPTDAVETTALPEKLPRMGGLSRRLGLLLPIFLMSETVLAQTTYEAEAAALANGAQSADCAFCSGGQQVKNIGGEKCGTVTFQHVQAPIAGLYPVTVLYNVSDDRSFLVTVNGKARFDLIFPRNGGRNSNVDSRKTFLAPLNTGENSIVFGNAEEFGPDLDAIIVGAAPVESSRIAGVIKSSDGSPAAGVEVLLSGPFQTKTVTDAQGRYEFPFLPTNGYYVRPVSSQKYFRLMKIIPRRRPPTREIKISRRANSPPRPGTNRSWHWANGASNTIWREAWRIFFTAANF